MLKNEGGILPFTNETKLAVFGKAQADYAKGCGGHFFEKGGANCGRRRHRRNDILLPFSLKDSRACSLIDSVSTEEPNERALTA